MQRLQTVLAKQHAVVVCLLCYIDVDHSTSILCVMHLFLLWKPYVYSSSLLILSICSVIDDEGVLASVVSHIKHTYAHNRFTTLKACTVGC